MPAIAQLVEHLTVDCCSHQMVPGSIPGGRISSTGIFQPARGFIDYLTRPLRISIQRLYSNIINNGFESGRNQQYHNDHYAE